MGNVFRASVALILLFSYSHHAGAKVIGLFDIDGTIFNDKGEDAAWRTPWLLKRIDQIHSLFQQTPNKKLEVDLTTPEQIQYYNEKHGTALQLDPPQRATIVAPDQIAVSYDEYHKHQDCWAKADGNAGCMKAVLLDYDPLRPKAERLIVPGFYREFDLTYKYYRETSSPASKSYLVQDYVQAKARAKELGGAFKWQGRAFELWQTFMSSPETVLNAQRFTSRGHRQEEYYALDRKMLEEGDIKANRGPNGEYPIVHSLSQPDARTYGENLVARKVAVVRGAAEALFRTSGSKHLELSPDTQAAARGERLEMHTEIVAEDEPSYVAAIAEEMVNLSGSYFADRVKFVLFNTGSDDDVKHSRYPYRWTVFHQRRARPATPTEIADWLKVNCEEALSGKGNGK